MHNTNINVALDIVTPLAAHNVTLADAFDQVVQIFNNAASGMASFDDLGDWFDDEEREPRPAKVGGKARQIIIISAKREPGAWVLDPLKPADYQRGLSISCRGRDQSQCHRAH